MSRECPQGGGGGGKDKCSGKSKRRETFFGDDVIEINKETPAASLYEEATTTNSDWPYLAQITKMFHPRGISTGLRSHPDIREATVPLAETEPQDRNQQPITWPLIAETMDRFVFITFSATIVLSTVLLFPYLVIAGSSGLVEEDAKKHCNVLSYEIAFQAYNSI